MTEKFGIIAEDNSDIDVIVEILSKYMDRNTFSFRKYVGNGCGKLKNKCDSWAKQLFNSGCKHVFVFHDLDRNKESVLRASLLKKIPQAKYPNSLIVIPIEELEGWLMSDPEAIKKVFSLPKPPKKISNCDTVKSPKEALGNLIYRLSKKRYLNTVHNKKISSHMSLDCLRACPSFTEFDAYILKKLC